MLEPSSWKTATHTYVLALVQRWLVLMWNKVAQQLHFHAQINVVVLNRHLALHPFP